MSLFNVHDLLLFLLFSRGHATLNLAVSVGPSVGYIFEMRAEIVQPSLPNRPRLSCRVSGLVHLLPSSLSDSVLFPLPSAAPHSSATKMGKKECAISNIHLFFTPPDTKRKLVHKSGMKRNTESKTTLNQPVKKEKEVAPLSYG